MLAVQEQIMEAAKTFKAVLTAAAQFGGEEVVEVRNLASNFWNWVTPSPRSRELKETYELITQVGGRLDESPLYTEDQGNDFVITLIHDICERRGICPINPAW